MAPHTQQRATPLAMSVWAGERGGAAASASEQRGCVNAGSPAGQPCDAARKRACSPAMRARAFASSSCACCASDAVRTSPPPARRGAAGEGGATARKARFSRSERAGQCSALLRLRRCRAGRAPRRSAAPLSANAGSARRPHTREQRGSLALRVGTAAERRSRGPELHRVLRCHEGAAGERTAAAVAAVARCGPPS